MSFKKIEHRTKQVLRKASFRPKIILNRNTNRFKLIWLGKIKKRNIIIKGAGKGSTPTNELEFRREFVKRLPQLQGENYSVKVSKRYHTTKRGTRIEDYYDLPTRAEVLDLYIHRVHPKVKRLAKKHNIELGDLYDICENAHTKFYKQVKQLDLQTDTFSGNVLIDFDSKGKIVFRLVDF